jgi:hypothetical protein
VKSSFAVSIGNSTLNILHTTNVTFTYAFGALKSTISYDVAVMGVFRFQTHDPA